MNNRFNKVLYFIFIFFSFFCFSLSVNANSIKKIEMDVYLDSSGNASITEEWTTYLNKGTEGYRTYTKLGSSTITNFTVRDDSGLLYKYIKNWNPNASFSSKAYKNGINYIDDGVELCWGISNYGNKTYTLKYIINDFVTQYTDTQGIYFNFLNLDQSVKDAKIIIRSDVPFTSENTKIWGFGNDGNINFSNGNIVFDSDGKLSKKEYMVALIKFEDDLFTSAKISYKSFDKVYDSAIEDINANKIDFSFSDYLYGIWFILSMLGLIFLNPIILILIFVEIIIYMKDANHVISYGKLDFGSSGNKLSKKNINYWREIPCNKNLEKAYWIAYNYKVVSKKVLRRNIIGAILLKWIKEGFVTVSKGKKKLFSFKDNNYVIDFSNMNSGSSEIENKLFEILRDASNYDNILEAKELKKWCKKNYNRLNFWFSIFNLKVQNQLEKEGLITKIEQQEKSIFGKEKTKTIFLVDPLLKEEAIKLKGLKKFLLDFSTISQREYLEVHIFEDYLIFAQLFGIANKVEKQFSKLYPNIENQIRINTELSTIAVKNITYAGYRAYIRGYRLERMKQYSGGSSSGFGGRSSSGGGRSAGGSSGGGFR